MQNDLPSKSRSSKDEISLPFESFDKVTDSCESITRVNTWRLRKSLLNRQTPHLLLFQNALAQHLQKTFCTERSS